ncbi:hypothetical protein ID866_8311 [Astraeus odoratus]|nr:hypothetical protein ID866_8311 [Astraeus odoratus]
MTDDNCGVQIPFTGFGITIYILNAGFQGVNASLEVDGTHSVTTAIPPPSPPTYQTPRVPLFDIQSLAYADHTATLSILDWNGGNTSLYFDYALVDDTTQTTTAQPTSSSSSDSTTSVTTEGLYTSAAASNVSSSTTIVSSTYSTSFLPSTSNTRAIEIGTPCAIAGALLIGAVVYYVRSRRRTTQELQPFPFSNGTVPPRRAAHLHSQSGIVRVEPPRSPNESQSTLLIRAWSCTSGSPQLRPTSSNDVSNEAEIIYCAQAAVPDIQPLSPSTSLGAPLPSSPTISHIPQGPPPSYTRLAPKEGRST